MGFLNLPGGGGSASVGKFSVAALGLNPSLTDTLIGVVDGVESGTLNNAFLYTVIPIDKKTRRRYAVPANGDFPQFPDFQTSGSLLVDGSQHIQTTDGVQSSPMYPPNSFVFRIARAPVSDWDTFPDSVGGWVELLVDVEPGVEFVDDGSTPTTPISDFSRQDGNIIVPSMSADSSGALEFHLPSSPPTLTTYNVFGIYDSGTGPKYRARRVGDNAYYEFDLDYRGKISRANLNDSNETIKSLATVYAYDPTATKYTTRFLDLPQTQPKEKSWGARSLGRFSFSDLTGWTLASGTAPTLTTTAGTYRSGSASFRFAATANYIHPSIFAGAAIDASGGDKQVLLRYNVPTGSTIPSFSVRFYSGSNAANVSNPITFSTANTIGVGWHQVLISIPSAATGSYAPNNVTGFGVNPTVTAGSIDFDFALVHGSDATKPATFILYFDDGFTHQYDLFASYLEGYGMRGIFPVTWGNVSTGANMTIAQMRDLDARGHDVVNHTKDHISWWTLDALHKREQFYYMKRWMIDQGLSRGADITVVNNSWGTGTYDDLRMLLEGNRVVIPHGNSGQLNPGGVGIQDQNIPGMLNVPLSKRILWRDMTDLEFTNAGVDAVIARRGFCGVNCHWVVEAGGIAGVHHTLASWRAVMDHLATAVTGGTARVVTLDEFLRED